MASVRSCPISDRVRAGSKMNPPLAKAQPVSSSGKASEITDLNSWGGVGVPMQLQLQKEARKAALWAPRSVKGEKMLQAPE